MTPIFDYFNKICIIGSRLLSSIAHMERLFLFRHILSFFVLFHMPRDHPSHSYASVSAPFNRNRAKSSNMISSSGAPSSSLQSSIE